MISVVRTISGAVLIAALSLAVAPTQAAACRLALALGLDVSGSVDDHEYDLQLSGIAQALAARDVREAFLAVPGAPVALAIYEWSSTSYQQIIVDWVLIEEEADLDKVQTDLLSWPRAFGPEATGLGAAMRFGAELIEQSPGCLDSTLDISGDGKNNDWPVPQRLRDSGEIAWLRINALVVASQFARGQDRTENGTAELTSYFEHYIIQGPGAFIQVAVGYDDYAEAMRRKLLRELATLPLGGIPSVPSPSRRASLSSPGGPVRQ